MSDYASIIEPFGFEPTKQDFAAAGVDTIFNDSTNVVKL